MEQVPPGRVSLTGRESEVLDLLGQGLNPTQVARQLDISVHTARGYIRSIHQKLGTTSQSETVVKAQQLGIITVADRLRMVLDRLPEIVSYWGADLRNVMVNQAYSRYLGTSAEEVHGMHVRDVSSQPGQMHLSEILRLVEETREPQTFERRFIDAHGRTQQVWAHYLPDIVGDELMGYFIMIVEVPPLD